MGKWLNVAEFWTEKRRETDLSRGLTVGYCRVPCISFSGNYFNTKNVIVMYVT
jgi:hypothetical protein